ncbi:MAG TPA: cob(I)yrinic acid a,c-diamide adenosyltransferase [Candidatus Saccharimonadales bacterium]|nr:cob(I)yrinic acid a,c-diamide adenosyltransferase [Candidatus Saccharimonadales bacterium]
MAFEDYKQKNSVVVVYTGNGKGKTSAAVGLLARSLGRGWRVAFVQFIKTWPTGEHQFIEKIQPVFKDKLTFYKGGKGFYNAGELSEDNISEVAHRQAAGETYKFALECVKSGDYDLVICDEISNAVHDGLLSVRDLSQLLKSRSEKTSLCLTGRNFPEEMLGQVDIATSMTKVKHHFDEKFLANEGIDY